MRRVPADLVLGLGQYGTGVPEEVRPVVLNPAEKPGFGEVRALPDL